MSDVKNTKPALDSLTLRAIAWRNGGDTGLSSVALVSFLMGWPCDGRGFRDDIAHPHDGDDFGRCYRALKALPELRERIGEAAAMSEYWANLVGAWDELEALYEEEVKRPDRMAPKLYERIKDLIRWKCPGCGVTVYSMTGGKPNLCQGCKP